MSQINSSLLSHHVANNGECTLQRNAEKSGTCLFRYSPTDLAMAKAFISIFVYVLFFIIIHSLWNWLSGNTSTLQRHNKTMSFFPLQTKCVGVFVKELKSILSNLTVYNDDRDTVTGIQNLLQRMEDQQPAAGGQQVSQQKHSRVSPQTLSTDCWLLPCCITADWIMAWRNPWPSPLSISGRSGMFDETMDKQSGAVQTVH